MKCCHLTSVHPWEDARIFGKMCRSLAEAGVETHLVAPRDAGAPALEVVHGVTVHAVARRSGRFRRATQTVFAVWRKARGLNADLYHLHDPELIPIGLLLRAAGRVVVFDFHEDFPSQVRGKHWIPPLLRGIASMLAGQAEVIATRAFQGIVAATPHIASRFPPAKTVSVSNFARLDEFSAEGDAAPAEKAPCLAYVGAITAERGLLELLDALALLPAASPVRLLLAGRFSPASFEGELRARPGWARVDYLGFLDRPGIAALLARCRVGMVTLRPAERYLDSQPVKMFEYMAAGLPVVASNFPLWRAIVEGAGCGLLVNPLDPSAIHAAIQTLLGDPVAAAAMGRRGRAAVETTYNWRPESGKLLAFYHRLTGKHASP